MAYDEKVKKSFLKVLVRTGGDLKAAAHAVGVSRRTAYNWKNNDPKMAKAIEYIRQEGVAEIEDCLFDNAKRGNVTAQIFILTNLMPQKYRHVSKIDVNKTENDLAALTNNELLAKIVQIAKELGKDVKLIEDIDYEETND